MNEDVIRTENEILAELIASDPPIRKIDEEITERKLGKKSSRDARQVLYIEKSKAVAAIHKAAKNLSNIIFKYERERLMANKQANSADLRYDKQKRIRYLRKEARRLHKDEATRATQAYHRRILGKKVSAPE